MTSFILDNKKSKIHQKNHLVGGGTAIAKNPLNWRPIGIYSRQNITTTPIPIKDKINNTLGKLLNTTFKDVEKVLMNKPQEMELYQELLIIQNTTQKPKKLKNDWKQKELPIKKENHCLGKLL